MQIPITHYSETGTTSLKGRNLQRMLGKSISTSYDPPLYAVDILNCKEPVADKKKTNCLCCTADVYIIAIR